MWRRVVLLTACSIVLFARNRKTEPEVPPHDLVIGRDTFFDFGPPFHYFEVISIEADGRQTRVARLLITPSGDTCTQPAQIELKEATVARSIPDLLEGKNPCSIPDRDLQKESKRCKHCLVFSGAAITMRVECNGTSRHLQMDILDRDMFDAAHARTRTRTSWTMRLLGELETALGPGPMDKPVFTTSAPTSLPSPDSPFLQELAIGKFDDLFPYLRGPLVLSDLYRQAKHPPVLSVEMVSAAPVPSKSEAPQYPPLARAAHISGTVRFTAKVGHDGHTTDLKVEGHPLLKKSVEEAVSGWKYENANPGTAVSGSIEFRINCSSQAKP